MMKPNAKEVARCLSIFFLFLFLLTPALPQQTGPDKPTAQIDSTLIRESSGIVASPTLDKVYWTHNDGGNEARIFAMNPDGKVLTPQGILVEGARNIDWEDIGIAPDGRLMLGAFGNNTNTRKDLSILLFPEPQLEDPTVPKIERVDFHYPDQTLFPPPMKDRAFDCEAIYTHRGKVYLVTKDRGPKRKAGFYRVKDVKPHETSRELEKIATHELSDMVTAADARGDRVAVLTYNAVYVFELRDDGTPGDHQSIPFAGRQCEAIAWMDDERVLITNEQKDIYHVKIPLPEAGEK